MKRKFAAVFFMTALLCVCLCGSAFAADGSVRFAVITEPRYLDSDDIWGDYYDRWVEHSDGCDTRIYCRNETDRMIQAESWDVNIYSTTLYPAVCYAIQTGPSGNAGRSDGTDIYKLQTVETTQSIPPFQIDERSDFWIRINGSAPLDSPFRRYRTTDYVFIDGQTCYTVFQDLHGKYFVQTGGASTGTYLTEDEVQKSLFPVSTSILIKDTANKNQIASAKLTFEDGTVEEFSFEHFQNPMQPFQNPPYAQQK